MSSGNANNRPLVDLLADGLREDVRTAARIGSVLTRTVPWQFPGRLLRTLATVPPEPADEERVTQAVVAIEFACLHQYLHAIPRTTQDLVDPAASSAYATDTVAAILDGDSLQACAFSRLEGATDDADLVEHYYERVSSGSIACYERSREPGRKPDALVLAPLAGVATRIGAHLGGFAHADAQSLERAGTALGEGVPIRTPSRWQPPLVTDVTDAKETVAAATGERSEARRRVERLLQTERELRQR